MDPVMQPDQTRHLEQLAREELAVANRHLTDAGRTIDELRSDVLALAARVDAARAEAESFKAQRDDTSGEVANLRRELDEALAEGDTLRGTNARLESHVARLKEQLERPGRLVVKKALRRGQYKKPELS